MKLKQVVLFGSLIYSLLFYISCEDSPLNPSCIEGEGTIRTETLSIASFSGIDLSIFGDVKISQGAVQDVTATGHPNILEDLKTSVSNNVWKIDLIEDCYENYELSIDITVQDINKIFLSGAGDIIVNDFNNQNNLEVDISGAGNIEVNEFDGLKDLDVEISGSGKMEGNKNINSVVTCDIKVSGSGNYKGFLISSEDCSVKVSGSANAELTATQTLDVEITGSGNVFYKGNPSITQRITGSGSLIDAN